MRTLSTWDSDSGPATVVDFTNLDEQLRYLRAEVTKWRQSPLIRNLAVRIIADSGAPSRDKKAQALAIANWVKHEIYYVHELPERFQTPQETLRLKAGDCDDTTQLIAALIEAVGIPAVLVCMKINGAFSHIFPAASLTQNGTLLPLDSTMDEIVSDSANPVNWAIARGKSVSLKLA